jgi:hypothetical protein
MRTAYKIGIALTLSGFTAVLAVACGPRASGGPEAPPPATPQVAGNVEDWLIENFEQSEGLSGHFQTTFDTNGLGTKMNPDPFVLDKAGSPKSPGGAARIWGTLGSNKAPWSWAQLQVFVNKQRSAQDLGKYRSLRFFAKGDGGLYSVSLVRNAIKNYDHYRHEFIAPPVWTEIALPLDAFQQAGWGDRVPRNWADVTMIQFQPAEHDKPFDLTVDDLTLSGSEAKLEPVAYNTEGWFAYRGVDVNKRRGTALDVSRLLDAPAGKHGILKKAGEHFQFADGTRARFWGMNIVASANFPSREEADKLAELLAQAGVNITRHHHMDAPWSTPNLFGNKESTLELDKDAMDRFDYFVAALQKRGIYQFFDLLVHRRGSPADGVTAPEDVANGYKIEGAFDPKLIELQEKFIQQFMGHQNPYTKRAYARDPGVAMLELINEDSLFYIQNEGDFAIKSPVYRAELAKQFSAWLKKNVPGGRAALEQRWKAESGAPGLGANEDPDKATVEAVVAFGNEAHKGLPKQRARDTFRFYYDVQVGYYKRLTALLRKLGYQGLVTGSNHWVEHPIDLKSNTELDFIDRHSYWAHPNGGWGYNTNISWNPSAMVSDPGLGVIGVLAGRRVKGLPYSTSEWQTSAPNDHRVEGALIVSAVAAFQNWSPIQFALSHDFNNKPDQAAMLTSNFDVIHQPTMLGVWPAASLLFHRKDVKEAAAEAFAKVDPTGVFDPDFRVSVPRQLPLIAKTGLDFTGGLVESELEKLRAPHVHQGLVTSPGGELKHDATRGLFEVNTPRSQGFVGFAGTAPLTFSNFSAEIKNPFALVMASSIGDEPIAAAKRVLISALGNAVNSGMSLGPSRNKLHDPGKSPILVEPIVGRVTLLGLTGALDKVKVFALDANGQRAVELKPALGDKQLSFELSASHQAMHYEVARE